MTMMAATTKWMERTRRIRRWNQSSRSTCTYSRLLLLGLVVFVALLEHVHGFSFPSATTTTLSKCSLAFRPCRIGQSIPECSSSHILVRNALFQQHPPNKGTTRFISSLPSTVPTQQESSTRLFATKDSAQDNNNDTTLQLPKKPNYSWTSLTLALAVPAWISMMADPLLSLMDTAFVGRLGTAELAALGACTSIFHLAFHAFRATTSATTTLVATASTEQEKQRVTQTSLLFGSFLGLLVMVLLKRQGSWAVRRMGIPTDTALYRPALEYLQTRAWAGPVVLALTVAEGAFRGYSNTRIPLVASAVASVINLLLDPLLMFPLKLGVRGAAAATALAQVGALLTYMYYLVKRNMLPTKKKYVSVEEEEKKEQESNGDNDSDDDDSTTTTSSTTTTTVNTRKILTTIVAANAAMTTKQASLLLGWAYATARATRLGAEHVAAHQVGLSFWLLFAFWLEGGAVAAQVLLGQSRKAADKVHSLSRYMLKLAFGQGLLAAGVVMGLGTFVPSIFTTDPLIRKRLAEVIPILALQQPLVSMTLVAESLAAGGQQFGVLAGGTLVATVFSMLQTRTCVSVREIWSRGIVTLFCGRLLTGLIGVARVNGYFGGTIGGGKPRGSVEKPRRKRGSGTTKIWNIVP